MTKKRNSKFISTCSDHIAAIHVGSNKILVAHRGRAGHVVDKAYVTLGFLEEDKVVFNESTVLHDYDIFYPAVAYDSLNDKVIVAYRNGLNGYGMVRIGTIEEDSIVLNEPVVFSKNNVYHITAMYDKVSEKVIIGYLEGEGSFSGIIRIGTISGNNITFSDPIVFSNRCIHSLSMAYDSDNNKVVLAYCDSNNKDKSIVKVGTLVDNSIVFGDNAIFDNSNNNSYYISMAYDHKSKRIVIAYAVAGDEGMARVGTVSGNNIVLSEPVVFNEHITRRTTTLYDHVNDKVLIAYSSMESNYTGHGGITINARIVAGTVTENSINFNEPVIFSDTVANGITLVSNHNKIAIVYYDCYNDYGTAKVI